ncbi:hypothetical protein HL033_01020 [Neoehrlichia mikurensis]|uniref:Uncharacterized protein n=1 Tax=Neoehrlichia mikurensis TaxID=89586 RepID=A0A9Q9BTW2_9RICK|nr:hypothetical protein [Neoehrlichia mikurensis]QXK92145.1 hypothetical protein IAH97_01015 [Neoehrlichia mikurensis]QXK92602.1 hypothetical protein HUN61_01020 [Neoehrlichia mikurensis]QXK93839.1 hypothetical protein HL033_01020 [Neoehrlichia mikurensis]UTO55166.1 hypothetical protein LUA82_03110 [Neoehrlichia mikurensis]UTO56086.1 hypothetical protein LUA81_03085 [Neoehrlichia mikurensis]
MLSNLKRSFKNGAAFFIEKASKFSFNLKSIGNRLSPINIIANLNPDFGQKRYVIIPGSKSQVIFKQQPCNYVPDDFFKKSTGDMFIDKNNLVYNNKKYPIIQLQDDYGNDIYDLNGNALFAINTNNQKKVFKDLHINNYVKNTIPVIACKDNIPVQVKSRNGMVMKQMKDVELNPFSIRIKNLESNTTNWILTLPLIPLYLFGDVIRFSLGIVEGLLKHVSNFFTKCADGLEKKIDSELIGRSTGALLNTKSNNGLIIVASVFRFISLVTAGLMIFTKNVKDIGETTCKVGNTFLNAMYNADDLQGKAGVAVLKKVSGNCISDISNEAKQCFNNYKLYKFRFSQDGKGLQAFKNTMENHNEKNDEKVTQQKNRESVVNQNVKQRISAKDKEEIKRVGKSLSEYKVLYGASEDLRNYSNQLNTSTSQQTR